MIPADLLRHSVTIRRRSVSGEDAHGNPTFTFTLDPAGTPCFVQVARKREIPIGDGETVIADLDVFFNADITPPSPEDELAWGAQILTVLVVHEEQAPGTTHHLVAVCKKVDA